MGCLITYITRFLKMTFVLCVCQHTNCQCGSHLGHPLPVRRYLGIWHKLPDKLTVSFSTIALFPWNCCPSHVRHDASICVEEDREIEKDKDRGRDTDESYTKITTLHGSSDTCFAPFKLYLFETDIREKLV